MDAELFTEVFLMLVFMGGLLGLFIGILSGIFTRWGDKR